MHFPITLWVLAITAWFSTPILAIGQDWSLTGPPPAAETTTPAPLTTFVTLTSVISMAPTLTDVTLTSVITMAPTLTDVTPASTTTYATGICRIHLREYDECGTYAGLDANLSADMEIFDGDEIRIYNYHEHGGDKFPINDANHTAMDVSPLPYLMYITGEHEHDYVQFSYGDYSWTNWQTGGPVQCKNGGWDPRGDHCENINNKYAMRQMDCLFPC